MKKIFLCAGILFIHNKSTVLTAAAALQSEPIDFHKIIDYAFQDRRYELSLNDRDVICNGLLTAQTTLSTSKDTSILNKHKDGKTPLQQAVAYNLFYTTRCLLGLAAKPNIQDQINGCTALHYAVSSRKVEFVKLLLNYGANPNTPNYFERSPLVMAVLDNNYDMVKLFIEHIKNNVNNPDQLKNILNLSHSFGFTLLHFAVEQGYEITHLLLEHGADANILTKEMKSTLQLAIESKNVDSEEKQAILKELLRFGNLSKEIIDSVKDFYKAEEMFAELEAIKSAQE